MEKQATTSVSCAAALPPSPEVTVCHCFQKCNKAVVAAPGNAIHHLMDDDPFNFTKHDFIKPKKSLYCSDL